VTAGPTRTGPDAIHVIPAEARPYQGRRAGVVSRVLAVGIDAVVIVVLEVALYAAWAGFLFLRRGRSFQFPTVDLAPAITIGLAVFIVYATVGWSTTGRTYGGDMIGLRVVDRRGGRLRPAAASVRAVLCTIFPLGLFWCVVSRENRSVQDLVLGSSVVYDWEVRQVPTGERGSRG
jgi:uncharacterized RDD family membrane protein YckC